MTRISWRPGAPVDLTVLTGFVIFCGVAIRVALADYSPWFDEYASMHFASQPLSYLWSEWMVRETNPPLFYSLLKGWRSIAGNDVVLLRLLPIICYSAGVMCLSAIGVIFFNKSTGLSIAVVTALSAQQIYVSHLLRGYSLAFAGVSLSLLGLLLLLDSARCKVSCRKGAAIYAAGSVIAIYSHTTMFLWPLIAAFSALLFWKDLTAQKYRGLRNLFIANIAVLFLSAFWLHITYLQITGDHGNIDQFRLLSPVQVVSIIWKEGFLVRDIQSRLEGLMRLIFAILLVCSLIKVRKNRPLAILWVVFAVSVIVFMSGQLVHPIIEPRTVYWMNIFPTVIVGAFIGTIENKWYRYITLCAISLILIANIYRSAPKMELENWRGVVETVARNRGVLVLNDPTAAVVAQEACHLEFPGQQPCPFRILSFTPERPETKLWSDGVFKGTVVEPRLIASVLHTGDRVYVFGEGMFDPMVRLHAVNILETIKPGQYWYGPFERKELDANRNQPRSL